MLVKQKELQEIESTWKCFDALMACFEALIVYSDALMVRSDALFSYGLC